MARENQLTPSFLAYTLVGLLTGALLGFGAHKLNSSQLSATFQASVVLFRLPDNGVEQAARDFIVAAINSEGFIDGFIKQHKMPDEVGTLLKQNLRVVARDASSSNAEIQLTGKTPGALDTTLDSLALYLAESKRSIKESELQTLLDRLDEEIATANDRYLELASKRSLQKSLSDLQEPAISSIAKIEESKSKLELMHQYAFQRQKNQSGRFPESSYPRQLASQLKQLSRQQQDEIETALRLAGSDNERISYAISFAQSQAKLRALRQAKQRLIIEFNQDTPLRVTGGAKIDILDANAPSPLLIIGACALIGTLVGGIACSLVRSRRYTLTGPNIEKRLHAQVLSVLPQSLTEHGEQTLQPLSLSYPDKIAVAAIRSLHVALHFFSNDACGGRLIVFSELDRIRHAVHVIANLAIDMANTGEQVLVVDETGSPLSVNLDGELEPRSNSTSGHPHGGSGSIVFSTTMADIPSTLDDSSSKYDTVLVLSKNPALAGDIAKRYSGIGVLIGTDNSRVSKMRKALAKGLQAILICGVNVEESAYSR